MDGADRLSHPSSASLLTVRGSLQWRDFEQGLPSRRTGGNGEGAEGNDQTQRSILGVQNNLINIYDGSVPKRSVSCFET